MRKLSELIGSYKMALDKLLSNKINLNEVNRIHLTDRKKSFYASSYNVSLKELLSFKTENEKLLSLFEKLKNGKNEKEIKSLLEELRKEEKSISYPKEEKTFSFKIPNVPEELADEVYADLRELEKCYNQECYRASVILCGRLLETALHRKYFNETGNDLLEKSPGIGLGNLIARMKERSINLDPALSQQIHLINQVRIYSVHKKQNSFSPNKDQAHAVILYTLDAVRKLL